MKLLQKASSLRPLKGRPRAIRPAVPAKDGSDPNDIDDITKLEIRLKYVCVFAYVHITCVRMNMLHI